MSLAPLIRNAAQHEAIVLARIHCAVRAACMPWLPHLHTLAETETWMATQVLPHQRVRVAVAGEEIIGLAAFSDGWLEQLYVLPEHQNAGIGTTLFNDVCTAAAPRSFCLWVFQRNSGARRFYERHGCRLVKLTDGQENEERTPDALYEKDFSQA